MLTLLIIIWLKGGCKLKELEIRKIRAEDCWPIRQKVMWPDRELAYVKLEKDAEGMHFGLFRGYDLLSIISLFIEEDRAQFWKFATLLDEQGKGYGTRLLSFLLEEVKKYPLNSIFCNARIERSEYYEKFGLKRTEEYLEKGGRKYVIMEKKLNTQ